MSSEHILVIRFSALGDVAMLVPVVYSFAKQYPNVRVTVLSRGFARPLFDGVASNVGFMEADLYNEYRGFSGLNALYRRLKAKNFTAIADMHGVLRSHYLRLRFNIDCYRVAHINKHRDGKRKLCAKTNKVMTQQPTAFDNYREVFEQLGYPVNYDFTSLFSNGKGNIRLVPPVIGEKKKFQQWIGIAPFAAHPGKIYPIEKMEQVVQQLISLHPSSRIFLFGGGDKEKKMFAQWMEKYKNCMDASGQCAGLMQEMIIMSHLDVMISMDSANAHFASIVNTPVVSVWGATHPFAGFTGWQQPSDNIVQKELECRPCSIYGNKPCYRGDYACLNSISPEDIIYKVEKILTKL